MHAAFDTLIELSGPFRYPRQLLGAQTYGDHASIHEDSTARRLGFAGAAIEGPTHFSQFDPLLVAVWGPAWFETGCLSAHFVNAAYEGDAVRAHVEVAQGAHRARISTTKQDGAVVLTGTATLDPEDMDTEVEQRLAKVRPPERPRIVDRLAVGDRTPAEHVRIDYSTSRGPLYPFSLDDKLAAITEPSSWYTAAGGGESPWRRPVLPTEMLSVLTSYTSEGAFPLRQPSVGLFVDLEVRVVAGPLEPGRDYLLERELVALGETRRTESCWVRSTVTDPVSGNVVASTLLNNAVLKESHPA